MTEPRIPPLAPADRDARIQQLLAALHGNRAEGDADELRLFTTLAHHPRLLRRWSQLGGTLLTGLLTDRDRELVILRTAWRCRAAYEWAHHVPIALAAGITRDEITRLTDPAGPWRDEDAALLAAVDELHDNGCITDHTWALLAERYDAARLIELCMLVGQYHLVAFTVRSLGILPEPGLEGFPDAAGP